MIIAYAAGLHLAWGITLLADAAAGENRLVTGLARDIGHLPTGVLLLVCAFAALASYRASRAHRPALLLPQQLLLFVLSAELAHLVATGVHPFYGEQPRAATLLSAVAVVWLTALHARAVVRSGSGRV